MTSHLDTRIILVFYLRITYDDIEIISDEYYIIHLSYSFTCSLIATHIGRILDDLEPIWVLIIVIIKIKKSNKNLKIEYYILYF